MLQELRVLHVISSRNGRYRPQAYSWPEVAIGQKRPVKVPTKLGAVQPSIFQVRPLSLMKALEITSKGISNRGSQLQSLYGMGSTRELNPSE